MSKDKEFKILVMQRVGEDVRIVARALSAPKLPGEINSFSAEHSAFGRRALEKIADKYFRNQDPSQDNVKVKPTLEK